MAAEPKSTTFSTITSTPKATLPSAGMAASGSTPAVGHIIGSGSSATNRWFKEELQTKKSKSNNKLMNTIKVLDSFNIKDKKYSLVKESENKYFIETSNKILSSKNTRTPSMSKTQAIIKFKNMKPAKVKFTL